MKFGKVIRELQVSVWQRHYLDYNQLKHLIEAVEVALGTKERLVNSIAAEDVEEVRKQFIKTLIVQLDQVDAFYGKLRLFFMERVEILEKKLSSVSLEDLIALRKQVRLWREYVDLNYSAARKILKKYDKRTGAKASEKFLPQIQKRTFYTASDVDATDSWVLEQLRKKGAPSEVLVSIEDFKLSDVERKSTMTALVDAFEMSNWLWYLVPYSLTLHYISKFMSLIDSIPIDVHVAIWTLLFSLQVIALSLWKVPLQASSFHVTFFFRRFQNPVTEAISDFLHHKVSTVNWILSALFLAWTHPHDRKWAHVYCFVGFGFVVKSIFKSFLQCPRGFWLWTSGSAVYCGKGFSLPSGHSMVSICFLAYVVYLTGSPLLFLITFLFELIVFVNVTFIGTHTFMDVIVGWTCGLMCLCLWIAARNKLKATRSDSGKRWVSKSGLVLFILATGLVLCLDWLETHSHPSLPQSYQDNMEKFCGIPRGQGSHKMSLKLAFTNTPLIIGIMIGHYLNSRFVSGGSGGSGLRVGWQQFVLCAAGTYVFTSLFGWCKQFLRYFEFPVSWAPYLHNFVSPILVLFGIPFVLRKLFAVLKPETSPESSSSAFSLGVILTIAASAVLVKILL